LSEPAGRQKASRRHASSEGSLALSPACVSSPAHWPSAAPLQRKQHNSLSAAGVAAEDEFIFSPPGIKPSPIALFKKFLFCTFSNNKIIKM
jgi:hypothetical protein